VTSFMRAPLRVLMSLLSFWPGRVGGAETYVRQFVAELPGVAGGDELLLLADRDLARDQAAPGWELLVHRAARAPSWPSASSRRTRSGGRGTLQRLLSSGREDRAGPSECKVKTSTVARSCSR
jgi:hypothetical protein